MKTKTKFVFLLVCAIFLVGLMAFASFAGEGITLLNDEDFTNSLGIARAANATHSGGYAQSAMVLEKGADGGGYAVFYPTKTGTNPAHSFAEVNYDDVYLNSTDDVRYFILELDVATRTQYVDGLEFEFIGKNTANSTVFGQTKPSIKTDANGKWTINAVNSLEMEQERGMWQHLTFIIEVALNNENGSGSVNSMLYTYYNGNFVGMGKVFRNDAVYLHSLRISYPSGIAIDSTDTLCIDNLTVTKLTDSYKGNLSSILADSSRSLTEFDFSNYKKDYVFPKTAPIAMIGDKEYSCVYDIESALKDGDNLVLLGDMHDTLNIPCEMLVYNPDGYEFNYDAGEYGVYTTDSTFNFIKSFSSLEVKWHIGSEVKTTTYTSPAVITPPAYDNYQIIDGIQYKAVGFSKSEGGKVTTDLGYASSYNCEFWLVYEKPSSYAAHKNGSRTYAYSDAEFDTLMLESVSGDTLVLLKNTVACSTDNKAAYTIENKVLTIDLSGFELEMAQTNNYDMFTVGAGGKLTVKNGVIEAQRNGRIPEGSTTIYRRRIFSVDYGSDGAEILADGLVINACKMIALIKDGVTTFSDCVIDFTGDYENMIDLYSSNNTSAPPTLNLVRCDIDTYKTVINTYKPSSITQNISAINITDCDITTAERIISAETIGSVNINGGKYKCQYFFGKENLNPSPTVKFSEGTEISCQKMDEKGKLYILYDSSLAKRNNAEYPYIVTKDYATITWKVFDNRVTEIWQEGEIPQCPFDVPQNTREIKYEFPKIEPASGVKIYNLELSANFSVKLAMELGMNLSFNVYIPEMNIIKVTVNEDVYTKKDMEKVLVSGISYYKVGLDFDDAGGYLKDNVISVSVDSEFGERTFEAKTSVIGYLDKILCGNYGDEAYELALSALLMVRELNPSADSEALSAMAKYKTDRVLYPMKDSAASLAPVAGAVSSVQLITDGKVCFRVNLNSSYSGELEFEFSDGAGVAKQSYTVSAGKVDGSSYIDICADATALISGIRVSAAEASGSFDIYSASAGDESAVIRAIYAYARCASAYVEGK